MFVINLFVNLHFNRQIKRINNVSRHLLSALYERRHYSSESNNFNDNPNPYSSLYVTGRYATRMFGVMQPLFGTDYLNVLYDNRNIIKYVINARNINDKFENFDAIFNDLPQLISIKAEVSPLQEKVKKMYSKLEIKKKNNKEVSEELFEQIRQLNSKVKQLNGKMWDFEETIMPFILQLPNYLRNDVPVNDFVVIEEYRQKNKNIKFKELDFTKLSYINQCLYPSIIGPQNQYYLGKGADLQFSLLEYFTNHMRSLKYIDFSGIDFVKSALIEACKSGDFSSVKSDSLRISRGIDVPEDTQQLHLSGHSSIESFTAFITKRIMSNSDHLRLFSVGTEYEKPLKQHNTVHAFCVTQPHSSDEEMQTLTDLIWKWYKEIGIRCRIVNCNAKQLRHSEYARFQIEVWIQSKMEWSVVSYVSHNSDYISKRIGLSDKHIIDSMVINTHPLIIAIIEQNQTSDGRFTIPECLKSFLLYNRSHNSEFNIT